MAADKNRYRAETAIFVAHEDHVSKDVAEAERNLMRAVLQAAMDDFRRQGESNRDARRFFDCRDEHYLYSFLSICGQLGLCPRTIRMVLGLDNRPSPSRRISADSESLEGNSKTNTLRSRTEAGS